MWGHGITRGEPLRTRGAGKWDVTAGDGPGAGGWDENVDDVSWSQDSDLGNRLSKSYARRNDAQQKK